MSKDAMDLTLIAKQARWNSERWFPDLHDQDEQSLRIHYALGLAGEVGEVANLFKKVNRGRPYEELAESISDEMADVFTYLILLADSCKVDLLAAFEVKQNICEGRWGVK